MTGNKLEKSGKGFDAAAAGIAERMERLVILERVSRSVSASLELSKVLDTIGESALQLCDATDIHIFLYNEDTGEFTFGTAVWADGRRGLLVSWPRPGGLTARVARGGKPIIIEDAQHHPLFATPEARKWGLRAIAGFPLKQRDEVIGVFNVAFLKPHRFTEEELQVLQLLACHAAIAIENARLYEETRCLAITDDLTGLHNRRSLLRELEREVLRSQRYGHVFALLLGDLDGFKAVNDTWGHLTGDEVLAQVASQIQELSRSTDLVARYGGDEFALLLPETGLVEAYGLAERVRAAVKRHSVTIGRQPLDVTLGLSVGLACYPQHGGTPHELLGAADTALYQAKAHGGDEVIIAGVSSDGRQRQPYRDHFMYEDL